ncbi:unnamed protein product [Allacma fusca]|uniref:Uncharacterized protein n=1 Tax=Allacma fusca TaxID=39272 RepID=A0A8J2LAT8_9HEXA|nr:unnamed protein product [Allacma fusca]
MNICKSDALLPPGHLILRCKPFAYALSKDSVKTSCDFCFKSAKDVVEGELARCAGCHLVLYCDRQCQKNGWNDGHKWECKGFLSQGKIAPTFTRVLLRVICRLQTGSDYYDVVPPKTHRRFKDLMSHYSDLKNDIVRMEQVIAVGKVVESILGFHKKITLPNESEIIALCGRIFVNTFSICNQEFQDLGTGLYIGASVFDHSCQPMAVATFHSTLIEIRSIVPLPASFPTNKITICYQDSLRPSMVRIRELRKCYYFDCQCERCSEQKFDSEMLSVYCSSEDSGSVIRCEVNPKHYDRCPKCRTEFSADYVRKVAETEDIVFTKINEMTAVTYLDVCESCISVMNSLRFSDTHWMKTHMSYAAFEACIDKQLWEKAFQYGMLAMKGQRKYLQALSPYLGITILKMAKLSWFLGKDKLASELIGEAVEIISITQDLMSWTLKRMAQYVKQSKYLQLLKENDDLCKAAFEKADFLFYSRGKPLLTATPKFSIKWKSFEDAESSCEELKSSSVLLTIKDDTDDKPLFACNVKPDIADTITDGEFTDMRKAILTLNTNEAKLVCRGHSLLKWQHNFKYCPSCAGPLQRNVSGTFQLCTNPIHKSTIHHYPQTCPVAITRVVDSTNERTVLVRQPRHPPGMYTCVAGFIEPGEDLENTVRREIAEEVGLVVDEIKYFGSQTWALPQDSLMLGCCAVAAPGSENLEIDKGELEGAKWFTKEEVREAFARIKQNPGLLVKNEKISFIVPPRGAIAHELLKDWISE